MQLSGIHVRPFQAADAAFAMSTTMMKGCNSNPEAGTIEHAYNHVHVRTRRTVENVFGIFKSRFHSLTRTDLNEVPFVTQVIHLYCAVHNVCMRINDSTGEDCFPTQDVAGADGGPVDGPQGQRLQGPEAAQAMAVRTALAEDAWANGYFQRRSLYI